MAATRLPVIRERDLVRTAEMVLQGHRQADIAEELGISQPTVCNDVKELRRRWRKDAKASIDQIKAEQAAELAELRRIFWERFRGAGKLDEMKWAMDGIKWCWKQRCNLYQILDPEEVPPAKIHVVMDMKPKSEKTA